ncbi:hypothetical protein ACFOEY_07465 [Paracandidimonas soli]
MAGSRGKQRSNPDTFSQEQTPSGHSQAFEETHTKSARRRT